MVVVVVVGEGGGSSGSRIAETETVANHCSWTGKVHASTFVFLYIFYYFLYRILPRRTEDEGNNFSDMLLRQSFSG